jgi:hypothetical protein
MRRKVVRRSSLRRYVPSPFSFPQILRINANISGKPQERPLRVKRSRKSNIPFEDIEAEAAIRYEANSPEPRGGNDSGYNNNLDIDRDSRNIGTGDEQDINDRTPSQGADRDRSLLAAAGPGGEERRSSGFRAVNTRPDSQGAVPMDVDEKPARGES